MSNKTSHTISSIIVAAAAIVCLMLWAYAQSISDLEKWSGIASAVSAVIGFFTFLVIVVYTRETFLLRMAAEDQAEGLLRPVVLVEIATLASPRSDPIGIKTVRIQNAGAGMAFNVQVEALLGDNATVEFPLVSNLPAGTTVPLEFTISENGSRSGCCHFGNKFGSLFENGKLPREMNCTATYESLSGRGYRTIQRILYDDDRSVVTRFRKLDPIR